MPNWMDRKRPMRGQRRGSGCLTQAIHRLWIEALETRQLLAANEPYISEFLADNQHGLLDSFNNFADWIEIHNPGTRQDLGGWALTDSTDPTQRWTFPANTWIEAGQYLLVFASGRNIQTEPELHTSFKLEKSGEYLALVRPDGSVASEYAPVFPRQVEDVSYGLGAPSSSVGTLLAAGAGGRAFVAASAGPAADWATSSFNESGWFPASTGLGFDASAGFTVRMVDTAGGSDGSISNINEALSILNGTYASGAFIIASDVTKGYSVINLGGDVSGKDQGSYTGDDELPNGAPVNNKNDSRREQYATLTTANIVIPAGTWTINVTSNAGMKLTIPGVSFSTKTGENFSGTTNPSPADTLVYGGNRSFGAASSNTYGTFTLAAPLATTLTLVQYETNGADGVELSIASGQVTFPTYPAAPAPFVLLGDGVQGWSVRQTSGAYAPLIITNLQQDMLDKASSAYLRIPFTGVDPASIATLTLRMKYDDGFVAYLNGTKVASSNAPASPAWNSTATGERSSAQGSAYQDFDISAFKSALRSGQNILAIQGLNISAADPDFLLLPEIQYTEQTQSIVQYFTTPTPRSANQPGALGLVADTVFSVDRGFFAEPFDLSISTPTAGAEIRYTTDGSAPSASNGTVYSGPIRIATTSIIRAAAFKPGYIASDTDTQTYIFLEDVIDQPASPAGFPTSWIATNNSTARADYEMDPEVVLDQRYVDTILADLQAIPSLSIVMNVDDLFGNGPSGTNGIKGIYSNPTAQDGDGVAVPLWERAASVELLYPNGVNGFQVNAGIQIQGGASRTPSNSPKHSFRLLFKDLWGQSKLNYDWFGAGAVDEFDSIILKAGYNKSWTHWDDVQRSRSQYVHDQWASDTQLAMGQVSKHSTYVHLYLNGLYWGLYSPMERPEASFAASYLGGQPEDYDVLNNEETLIDGDRLAWEQMFSIANRPAGDLRHISTPEGYADIKQYLDVEAFADYMLLNFYGGNQDWADHNWYAFRRSRVDGVPANIDGFRFVSFDTERILEDSLGHNVINLNQGKRPTGLFQQLRKNAEFVLLFADRVHKHLFNDGALSANQAAARYRSLIAQVDRAVVGESARWGDYRRDVPNSSPSSTLYTRDDQFLAEENRLLSDYFPKRTGAVLNMLRSAGLYPALDAPEFNQPGGIVSDGFELSMIAPGSGSIYYTTDGTDPRLPGGEIAPSAQAYSGALALAGEKRFRARVLKDGAWSAITDATFHAQALPSLRIAEVMYHPKAPVGSVYSDDDYQFIELQNVGSAVLDLGGIRLSGAGDFVFPSMVLPPGARTVVVSNAAAFLERYGLFVPPERVFAGRLSHSGERLALRTALGRTIQELAYKDSWYEASDGKGYSLVADPAADEAALSTAAGWRVSSVRGGTPNAPDDLALPANAILITEVMANPASGSPWIELQNTTNRPIDISGWFLSDDKDNRTKYAFPALAPIPGNGTYRAFYQQDYFAAALSLSALGGALYLASSDGQGGLGNYREAVDYGPTEPGLSYGRHVKRTGGSDFAPLASATFQAPNSAPKVGPVVINEIMHTPWNGGDEFIELANITSSAVPLHDGTNGWSFTAGINFTFPAGASIPANGLALVVPIDPATFRNRYAISASVPIFGPYAGILQGEGEDIKLGKPLATDPLKYLTIDRVNYEDAGAWPVFANGYGASLQRLVGSDYGNDALNWGPSPFTGTPGRANTLSNAPQVDAGPDLVVNEGELLVGAGSFADPDFAQGFIANVDWGDSASPQYLPLSGKTFTLSHTYASSGVYTVRVTVADGHRLWGIDTLQVTVRNVAPTASLPSASAGAEGQGFSIAAPYYVADVSPADAAVGFRYSYDFDNDGTFEIVNASSGGASVPGQYVDGPSMTVRLRVIDQDGGWTDYLQTVSATNLPPTATFSADQGILRFTDPADPSAADAAAGFTYSYDFDNDGLADIQRSPLPWAAFVVAAPGTYPVRGWIFDKDGGYSTYTAQITVVNAAPVVDAGPDRAIALGQETSGLFSDSGPETHSATIDFNDGAGPRPLDLAPDRTFRLSYPIPGTYSLTIRVTDSFGLSGSDTLELTVLPTLHATAGADHYTLRRDPSASTIEVFRGALPAGDRVGLLPVALASSLAFDASDGDDRLVLDLSNGAPIPAGGLYFNGGDGADALLLSGLVPGSALTVNASTVLLSSLVVNCTSVETLTLDGGGGDMVLSSLVLGPGARLALAPGGRLLRASALSLGADATLNLADNALLLQSTPKLKKSALATLTGQIASAYSQGAWSGPGLSSSAAAASNGQRTLGILLNDRGTGSPFYSTFAGQPASINDILIKYTHAGDADLNGRLDASDYFALNRGQAKSLAGWSNGDFNYDTAITLEDYTLLDRAFLAQPRSAAPQSAQAAPAKRAVQPKSSARKKRLRAPRKI